MNNNLLFDFTVDKEMTTVFVNREFNAGQALVWDAFTKKEILDQWWAPQPWKSETKHMDFKEGGHRFYAMVGPEGDKHWSIQKYTSIHPITNIKWLSSFVDANENVNIGLPTSKWNLDFSETEGVTMVKIAIKHEKLEDIEMHIQMGFKEGFTATLNYLEKLLSTTKNKKNEK